MSLTQAQLQKIYQLNTDLKVIPMHTNDRTRIEYIMQDLISLAKEHAHDRDAILKKLDELKSFVDNLSEVMSKIERTMLKRKTEKILGQQLQHSESLESLAPKARGLMAFSSLFSKSSRSPSPSINDTRNSSYGSDCSDESDNESRYTTPSI